MLRIALAADKAAIRYDIDVLLITPYTEIRRVAENTSRLLVIAPYMDCIRPGRGMADVLPEALLAAGARGVVVNHCERPMPLSVVRQTIQRAHELDLLSFACADTIAETKAIAHLRPDIINPEPTELIGSKSSRDFGYVMESIRAVKEICPDILVEQAAGVSSGADVYQLIYAGAEAVGASSGILCAKDPCAMLDEMIHHIRLAYIDRNKMNEMRSCYENSPGNH